MVFFLVKPFFFSFTWEQMLYDTFTSPHLTIYLNLPGGTYLPTYLPMYLLTLNLFP